MEKVTRYLVSIGMSPEGAQAAARKIIHGAPQVEEDEDGARRRVTPGSSAPHFSEPREPRVTMGRATGEAGPPASFEMPPMVIADERENLRNAYLAKIAGMSNAKPHWIADYDRQHAAPAPRAPLQKMPTAELVAAYEQMNQPADPRASRAAKMLEEFDQRRAAWEQYNAARAKRSK